MGDRLGRPWGAVSFLLNAPPFFSIVFEYALVFTVAILAQGTSWAVAATQAFLLRLNNDWWQLLDFVACFLVFCIALKQGTGPSSSPCNYFPLPTVKDTLAERLRRRPAKPMGSPRVGSNPTGVVFGKMPKMERRRELNLRKKACVAATAQLVP